MSKLWISILYLVTSACLSGCSVGSRTVEAPVEYLTPSGWQDNQALLQHPSFSEHAKAVTNEVLTHRIPFDPERAKAETTLSSPVEIPLPRHCEGVVNGIAILVHGLAGTAFSLRDIGTVLADVCYQSRVILLPGHGTRSGDLLTTRRSDWQETLHYLIDQAIAESDTVLLVGFSLGAVLTLDAAVQRQDDIDGIIGISPAYFLSSERLTKWAPLAAPLIPWVDRGIADDPMRYEAMPTRGVAETWSSMQQMHQNLNKYGPVTIPWMLAQSMDDAVVVPDKNEALWRTRATNPASRVIRFVSDQEYPEGEKTLNLSGKSTDFRVLALTHLAIHQSPENPHYGITGSYRNCGAGMPRDANIIKQCEQSKTVWYGLWSTTRQPGRPMAYSTFNPSFDQFADEIKQFANALLSEQVKG